MPVQKASARRKPIALVVALLSVAGCTIAGVDSRSEAYDAGFRYGERLADMASTTETPLSRCALAITNGRIRDLRTGDLGDRSDYDDAEFIDGCFAAVRAE